MPSQIVGHSDIRHALSDLQPAAVLPVVARHCSFAVSAATRPSRIIDLTAHLTDFVETAALVSCLDLVITVDTSIAHLAATLARPTWILLPYTPDFRWLLDRDDSPWYPTAKLFRQNGSRD
jgi:ADP-heptose:LPS heptosyltransferase